MRQVFFRLGEVILELIGQPDSAGEGDPGFFGLAITVDDLDAPAALLGEHLGPVEGRRAGGPADRHAAPPRPRHVAWRRRSCHRSPSRARGYGDAVVERAARRTQHPAGAGAEHGAAAAAGDGQHVAPRGGEGVERPLAAELAAAADGAVGEGHAVIVPTVDQ